MYAAVQEIPRGRVTSYGHIARLLGKRTSEHAHHDSTIWHILIEMFRSVKMLTFHMSDPQHNAHGKCHSPLYERVRTDSPFTVRFCILRTLFCSSWFSIGNAHRSGSVVSDWIHRQVGVCLKHLPSHSTEAEHHFHDRNVPWQRVINAKGGISPRQVFVSMLRCHPD